MILAGHGIICWADSARACYEQTIGLIAEAASYLNSRLSEKPVFGGALHTLSSSVDRAAISADLATPARSDDRGAA